MNTETIGPCRPPQYMFLDLYRIGGACPKGRMSQDTERAPERPLCRWDKTPASQPPPIGRQQADRPEDQCTARSDRRRCRRSSGDSATR